MKAVICDIYGTLLRAGPPHGEPEADWQRGCAHVAGLHEAIALAEFNARCAAAVASQHRIRRAGGEPFPEVNWFAVVAAALNLSDDVATADRLGLLSDLHASCSRTCTAMPGAIEALDRLRHAGVRLGIASNSQPYTRGELTRAGFTLATFEPTLCFFSGDHGFAKPSPRVFQLLSDRLTTAGITPADTLMAGDSLENDILPATAAGWQTWHLTTDPASDWRSLANSILTTDH